MSPPPIQWYLARDGKQFGPLSEAELAKFIELGHLLPTDLLWRDGFTEWRPAPSVFPPKAAAPVAAPKPEPAPVRPQPAAAPAAVAAAPAQAQRSAQQQLAAERREPTLQQTRPRQQQPLQQPLRTGLEAGPRPGFQPGQGQQRAAMASGAALQPQRPAASFQQPQVRQDPDYRQFDEDTEFEPGSTVLRRIVAILLIVSVLGAAVYFGYPYRRHLAGLFGSGSSDGQTATIVSERRGLDVPPFKGFESSPAGTDANLQQAALWRILKREFPEWYEARIKEASDLAAKQTDNAAIAQQMAQALVQLRRQQLNNALSAGVPRLKLVATTFFENLVQLRKTSDVACFEFIARGEASPLIVTMLQGSAQVPALHAQMSAVYEAIADGRKTPRAYPSPKREDYEALAADLTKQRGWTQADLQLFTDERALAQAPPGKVCQLVHDWFAAQLDVKDPDMQVRLLVDSLKPVVAG